MRFALFMGPAFPPDTAVSRRQIIERLGERPDCYDLRRMEILVRRLRHKVEAQLAQPLPLETVHGIGYAFVANIRIESR